MKNNVADIGGGVYMNLNKVISIIDSIFRNNTGSSSSGGLNIDLTHNLTV